MRYTFTQLQQIVTDLCIDDQTTSTTGMTSTDVFIKREINSTVSFLFSLLREYQLQPGPRTASTVAAQTYYAYPADLSKVESITVTVGTIAQPLKIVQSQEEWDRLQQFPISSGFPTHAFPRQLDFGIYPTPNGIYTMTLNGNYRPVNMTENDYITGTIACTTGLAVITGSGTTFTSSMVDRFLALTTGGIPYGNFYNIASYQSATQITLSTIFNDLTTSSGLSYVIGQSPNIPDELHEFIPYRVASAYWMTRRHDAVKASQYANYFYTGDFNNPNRKGNVRGGVLAVLNDLKMKGRENSNLVEMGSYNPNNYITNTIWGTTLS